MNRQSTHLGGTQNTPGDTTVMNGWHYTFVQIHRMHKTKSKSQHELRILARYDVSAQVHLLGDAVDAGGCACI